VRYLNSPRPGLSRARNDGARACCTELVAYLDDDAWPHRDWLATLAREFADPRVMAVGGEELRPVAQCEMERLSAGPVECAGGKRRPARNIGLDTPGLVFPDQLWRLRLQHGLPAGRLRSLAGLR